MKTITSLGLPIYKLWTTQMTEESGGHSFVPIAAKWLASGTDDADLYRIERMRDRQTYR